MKVLWDISRWMLFAFAAVNILATAQMFATQQTLNVTNEFLKFVLIGIALWGWSCDSNVKVYIYK